MRQPSVIQQLLEQEKFGAWTARDFYLAAPRIVQELRAKPDETMEPSSSAARARLGYLLGFSEISGIHSSWHELAEPFSGYDIPGFWMSDNSKACKMIGESRIPVDELAHAWGLCAGAPILSLRRCLKGEVL